MIDLHKDENVILFRRRHWLPITIEAIGYGVAMLVPFVLVAVASQISGVVAQLDTLLFLSFVWSLLLWSLFFVSWTNYYLDVLLVTNKRVVDVEQVGLFARDIAETRIANIQDVSVEVLGFLPSLLDFGDVHIQTAGATKEVVVHNIRDPHAVRDAIAKAQEELHVK